MTLMTQTLPDQQNSRIFILLFMSMLSAFGPFVTDFYLPALPQLVNNFDTTTSLVQLTLTFSMLGLAIGQMIIGPLSDKLGRRNPLIISLILFVISTVACLYANDIHTFIVCRLIQGLPQPEGLSSHAPSSPTSMPATHWPAPSPSWPPSTALHR